MNWYIKVLKNYVTFNGRARRKEYWIFFLVNTIISAVLTSVDSFIAGPGNIGIFYYIGILYSLAVLLPGLAVSIRRLHDTGRSGWWLLILLIPLIGAIVLLIFMAQDSNPGENQFGPNPKEFIA